MELVEVVITGVTQYSFEDKTTGNLVEGCNVHFLNLDTEDNSNSVGYMPMKSTLPLDSFKLFTHLDFPHYCQATVKLALTGKRPTVKFTHFDPIYSIELLQPVK